MRFVHFRLVAPAVIGIALLIAVMASFPYFGAARVDEDARRRQEALVERNIALWIQDIEFSLTAWTIWDDAIGRIDNAFDREWVDRNIGASLIGTSRTRFAAVLDHGDALIYSRTDETVRDNPFFVQGVDSMVGYAAPLLASVRRQELSTKSPGIPKPVAFSRIEVLGDQAVLLTASLFQPDFGMFKLTHARAPVLITAMPIGGSLTAFFGERFLLDDPQVGPLSEVAPDRALAGIATGPNGEAEVLSWRPPRPAADVVYQSLPLILTVGVVLVMSAFFALRVSQSAAQGLVSREQQMRHAATHDFLTGLANRALLEPEFCGQAARGPLTVVCLDLDGFKGVNDTHGHAMGDELLKVVAARLRTGIRDSDRLFRLGGDEFAILMPQTALSDAADTCRRLAASVALPVSLSKATVTIGASFGIHDVTDSATTCDKALQAADAALYKAKSRGRGCVVTAAEMTGVGDAVEEAKVTRRAS